LKQDERAALRGHEARNFPLPSQGYPFPYSPIMPRLLAQYVSNLPNLEEMFPLPTELISQRENSTEFPDATHAGPHDHHGALSLGADLWEASAEVTAAR
jgi:hypothetical protein